MSGDRARIDYALRLGDDALVLGQRLGEWCGHAPMLEVDLGLANIALDLIGQAQHFLAHAGALEGHGRDADKLAFRRDVLDFKNCLLVEQPNGDFAQTIARQALFSTWHELMLQRLQGSSDTAIAAVAQKAVKEVAYHASFAREWVVRLGDGTAESRQRMVDGLDWMWRFVDELFAMDLVDQAMAEAGVGVDKSTLRPEWDHLIDAMLAEATLERPAPRRGVMGGREGRHSEHLGHMLSEMQFLQRAYPDAVW
ncbi:MAG: phenylacetate-CoA oxygenase subunit PaaC [Proteobacteria bacterium]|nr:phenylacetate-CoA oxygenase subunit PaaC [Pseudomonadota bacterium]